MRLTILLAGGAIAGGVLAGCGTGSQNINQQSYAAAETRLAGRQASWAARSSRTQERSFTAYLTAYSYWDNTPPGTAAIARPVLHRKAGGTGTYQDPVTIAVGHKIAGGRHTMDYPAGTRFYLPKLHKYAIVEDLCGDGARPQDGPCHTGHKGYPWLDIYIGGKRAGKNAAASCAYRLTGVQRVIMNPHPGYPVARGPVTESGCKRLPV